MGYRPPEPEGNRLDKQFSAPKSRGRESKTFREADTPWKPGETALCIHISPSDYL